MAVIVEPDLDDALFLAEAAVNHPDAGFLHHVVEHGFSDMRLEVPLDVATVLPADALKKFQ